MYQTQNINVENYPQLRAFFCEQTSESSDIDKFVARGRNRFGHSLSDLSVVHPEAVISSSQDLGWQNIHVVHMRHTHREIDVPPLENHCVILSLGPLGPLGPRDPQFAISASIAGYDYDRLIVPGEIAIIPSGLPLRLHWHNSRSQETLQIYLHPQFVQKTAELVDLNRGQIAIEPQLGIKDERLSYTAMSLLCELKEENLEGRFYADSVASALAILLVRRYSYLNNVRIGKGGMAPHKLRRAIALISDHIEQQQELALGIVAEKVGMSYYHFSRAFKQSMGLSPINYIVQQRIERAKRLLVKTELPIAEIALQVGFSSQSHFTTSFRKVAGVTPSSFRRGI